jgi:hypothetical protein
VQEAGDELRLEVVGIDAHEVEVRAQCGALLLAGDDVRYGSARGAGGHDVALLEQYVAGVLLRTAGRGPLGDHVLDGEHGHAAGLGLHLQRRLVEGEDARLGMVAERSGRQWPLVHVLQGGKRVAEA